MPTTSVEYPVGEGPVFLEALIGDGQIGGSAAFLGPERVAEGGRALRTPLGPGGELRGRVLVVSTTVVDFRTEHDRASVQVTVGHADQPMPVVQTGEVVPGGALNFLTVVRFV